MKRNSVRFTKSLWRGIINDGFLRSCGLFADEIIKEIKEKASKMERLVRVIAIVAVISALAAGGVSAGEMVWKHVKETVTFMVTFNSYYDPESVEKISDTNYTLRIRILDARKAAVGKDLYERVDLMELNCAEKKGRVLEYGRYRHLPAEGDGSKNDLMFFKNYEWHPISPDSSIGIIMGMVCT